MRSNKAGSCLLLAFVLLAHTLMPAMAFGIDDAALSVSSSHAETSAAHETEEIIEDDVTTQIQTNTPLETENTENNTNEESTASTLLSTSVSEDVASDKVLELEKTNAVSQTNSIEVQSEPSSAESSAEGAAVSPEASAPAVTGSAHVQNLGWRDGKSSGGVLTLGTTGRSLRVEALRLKVSGGSVSYRAHVQDEGWQSWRSDGADAGTTGRSRRVEAVKIKLSDALEGQGWSVRYRVHVQNLGWMGWARDGEVAGTSGMSLRVEAVEVRVVADGSSDATGGGAAYRDAGLGVEAHVQNVGWQGSRSGYDVTVGTTGRGLRMEALRIRRPGLELSGDVVYSAHVQNVGWQGSRRNGQLAGTTGRSLRVEALRVSLTGELADAYDVWYRCHVQNVGWMAWASNGDSSGTEGLSLRVEAVQVALVRKGAGAPSSSGQAVDMPFITKETLSYTSISKGSSSQTWVTEGKTSGTTGKSLPLRGFAVRGNDGLAGFVGYSVRAKGSEWTDYVSDGSLVTTGNTDIEAIRIKLSGPYALAMDVWYRVHVANIGWLSWTKNGAQAGSSNMGLAVEAVQVRITPKGASPGSTNCAYASAVSGDTELDIILAKIYRDNSGMDSGALKRCYDYVATYSYRTQNTWPAGSWWNWSKSYAKEMYKEGRGNCYRYSSLMCWLARGLGYDASVYCGQVMLSSGELAAHGWVEVKSNGTTYILDPDMQHSRTERNFYWQTYESSPIEYYR